EVSRSAVLIGRGWRRREQADLQAGALRTLRAGLRIVVGGDQVTEMPVDDAIAGDAPAVVFLQDFDARAGWGHGLLPVVHCVSTRARRLGSRVSTNRCRIMKWMLHSASRPAFTPP